VLSCLHDVTHDLSLQSNECEALLIVAQPSTPRGFDVQHPFLQQTDRFFSEIGVILEKLARVAKVLDLQEGHCAAELLFNPHERIDSKLPPPAGRLNGRVLPESEFFPRLPPTPDTDDLYFLHVQDPARDLLERRSRERRDL
jgi:hypothetical protein